MAVVGQAMQGGKSWAKARLVRGQSAGGVWEIDQQYPQARLAIGSDPGAGWSIQAPGVRPMHFEMYWDGRCLFVADTQRAGGVTLNGTPLGGEWMQVRGRGEVAFGQAALSIETSDAQSASMPDPASARRIAASEGPSASHNIADLTSEATRMTDSPSWQPMEGEATRIQESELDAAPAPPPQIGGPKLGAPPPPPKMGGPPAGPQRPRLGGSNDPVGAPQKTLTQDELGPALGEATRMVSMPEPGAPPSIVLAPGLGNPGSGPVGGPPMIGGPPMQQQGFAQPSAPTGPGGFAAPPGFGEAPPPARPVGGAIKLPFGLTPRTAAMVGALVLAILVLLAIGLGDSDEEELVDAPPPTAPPASVAPPTSVAIAPTTVAGYPVPTVAGYPPPSYPPPTYAPPTYAPVTALVPPTTGAAAVPTGPTPERLAADQVLAGRYNDALPLYQALAMQHPERPEYSMMVHILQQRILAAQCVNGIGPDGRPCTRQ